jgi:cytochrome c biogenesis protein CcmG, thiol:disulfide interchange protein DsbE
MTAIVCCWRIDISSFSSTPRGPPRRVAFTGIEGNGPMTEQAVPSIASGVRFSLWTPLATFLAVAVVLGIGLFLDPSLIPSPLIGKPVPDFQLPPVQGRSLGLASTDLNGEVSLVNVFASWCVECRTEHPVLMRLAASGQLPIHGINYKDAPEDAARWLDTLGDPYTRTGADRDGRVGIDWGVYGVPETFVIDRFGVIAYKYVGPISQAELDGTILPLIKELREQRTSESGADSEF